MGIKGLLALFLLMAGLLLAGCGETATPTTTPSPTLAPTPTATLTPMPTPTPTTIPSPTLVPTPSLFPLTIPDSQGGEIVLESPPERIVALDSAAVEILFAIGEQDRIVGTHDFADYPPEVAGIEKVGSAFALDHERVLALESDLVYTFFQSPVADLEALGLKVLYLDQPATLEGIAERIRLWGEITGNPSAAESVATDYAERLAALDDIVAGLADGPRVWHDLGDFFTVGRGSLIDDVYTRLGAQNIAGDTEGFPQLSPEVIVDRNPQVIVTTDPGFQENILDNPAFADVSAVKDGRVAPVLGEQQSDFLSIAGPRMIDWTEELAQILYPELNQ